MPSPLDAIWLDAAARLGIPVDRGGDAYVHYTGARLLIADDEHLDSDDTVAQLVLHELCHALVQGPANLAVPDWGLDNTSERDSQNELACVRLQAHFVGAHGLRHVLFPTTAIRAFFFALPHDALSPADGATDDEPARLARVAALRAATEPWAAVLHEALAASSRVADLAIHRKSAWPLLTHGDARCGQCAWRTTGGLCRQAPRRVFVDEPEPACVRFELTPDCQLCGACCRSAYDSVTISRRDPVVRRHPALVAVRETFVEMLRDGDHCAALAGAPGGPHHCAIYDDRPRPCRDFENSGRHCLDARRRVGLTA